MDILIMCLIFFSGVSLGAALTAAITYKKPVGKLRIDRSEPNEAPYLFLELSQSVSDIEHKKHVLMQVKSESFIPHK